MLSFIRPEFFDIFGILVFIFIIFMSIWGIKFSKPIPRWAFIILLFIGILGLTVDSLIVFNFYLK